jgi:hypothetical protein
MPGAAWWRQARRTVASTNAMNAHWATKAAASIP